LHFIKSGDSGFCLPAETRPIPSKIPSSRQPKDEFLFNKVTLLFFFFLHSRFAFAFDFCAGRWNDGVNSNVFTVTVFKKKIKRKCDFVFSCVNVTKQPVKIRFDDPLTIFAVYFSTNLYDLKLNLQQIHPYKYHPCTFIDSFLCFFLSRAKVSYINTLCHPSSCSISPMAVVMMVGDGYSSLSYRRLSIFVDI